MDMAFHLFLTDFRFQMSPMEPSRKSSKASPVKSFQGLLDQLTDHFQPAKLDTLYNQYAKHLSHIYKQQKNKYLKSLSMYEQCITSEANISEFRELLKIKEE